MKTKIIATALTLALATASVSAQEDKGNAWGKYEEQNVGTGWGVIIGTALGGPLGAVVGGYIGNTIGEAEGQDNEIAQLNSKVQNSENALAQIKANKDQQLIAAQQKIAALEQQYVERQMQYEKQMTAMHQRTAVENALAVSMQFRTGSAEIEAVYQKQLMELAQTMKSMTQYSLDLSGYADRQGEEKFNYQLSKDRANAVKAFLISQGIDPTRISTKAYGETQPLQAKQSLQSDFFDRRVLLKLSPASESVASTQQ